VFATKPALAQRTDFGALDVGMKAKWVTGDEVYGNNTDLRAALEHRNVGYVMAVSCDHRLPSPGGPVRADSVARGLPARSWQVPHCRGRHERAPVVFLGAAGAARRPARIPVGAAASRRHHRRVGVLPVYSLTLAPLPDLVFMAGRRWKIEESFQAAKGQAGLDRHQVRAWTSWHRWTILAMAFLAVTTATERDRTPAPAGLIPLTLNEFRRLFDALAVGVPIDRQHILTWSTWRRKHQSTARLHHYRSRSRVQEPNYDCSAGPITSVIRGNAPASISKAIINAIVAHRSTFSLKGPRMAAALRSPSFDQIAPP